MAGYNITYWQDQGKTADDIMDPSTGVLKPGWTRTVPPEGGDVLYEYNAPTTPTSDATPTPTVTKPPGGQTAPGPTVTHGDPRLLPPLDGPGGNNNPFPNPGASPTPPAGGYQPPPPPSFSPPGYTTPPAFTYPEWHAPDPWKAPTAADAQNEPGYQFRLGQGEQALQQSAAAKGVLNTGGTLKDILGYGQDFASAEYQNVWNRSQNAYQGAYDTLIKNYLTGRGSAVENYNTNYRTQYEDPYRIAYTGAADRYAPQLAGWQTDVSHGRMNADNNWSRTWNKYLTDYDTWHNWDTDYYNRLRDQQKLGAGSLT